jgi:RNA polymerase sigma factor for flagellar operon FliA
MSIVGKFNNTRENIILKHIPLVEKIADHVCKSYNGIYEREDIVNIGVIGLIDAIEKYDPSRKATFETYARWRIRGAIIDELRASGKISRSKMDKVNRLYEAIDGMQQRLNRRPTDAELTEHLQISNSQLNELYSAIHFLSSFSLESAVFSNADQEFSLMDMIEDQRVEKPDDALIMTEQKEILRWAIEQLKQREQVILNLIYFEDLAVKDIAELLDVSSSRISQIHGKILTKIRHNINNALEMGK